jgi:hypothetical protein
MATIKNVAIIDHDSDRIKLLVVTDRQISNKDKTWCIDHVYLSYNVSPSSKVRQLNTTEDEWDFPFSARDKKYISCPNGIDGFCSEWTVLNKNTTSINLILYEYNLMENSIIQLQLGGGNMLGCYQHSNVYNFSYKQ